MWTRTYRHAYELLLVFYDRDTRTEFVGSENWLVKGPVTKGTPLTLGSIDSGHKWPHLRLKMEPLTSRIGATKG